jgi:hypothetical protein
LPFQRFAQDIMSLCARVKPILENETRCLFLESPCYVLGDIHGNLEDLNFFADNLWKIGINLTAGRFLFLGAWSQGGRDMDTMWIADIQTIHSKGNHTIT